MARIGKCRRCKKGWVLLGSYASVEYSCDAIGFCRECFERHRLEFCHNESINYKIMEDWKVDKLHPLTQQHKGGNGIHHQP